MPRRPKPFKNPRIEVGAHGRTWQTLSPTLLETGDIVAGKGQVVEATYDPVFEFFTVSYFNGAVDTYDDSSEPVLVFAKKVVDE